MYTLLVTRVHVPVLNAPARRYQLGSQPKLVLAEQAFDTRAASIVSWGQRALSAAPTNATVMSFYYNLASAPRRWGIPLIVTLLDAAATTRPFDCTGTAPLCNGFKFYTVCFGGSNNRIHCDEMRDPAPNVWNRASLSPARQFEAKYGAGKTPSSVKVQFAAVSSDEPAEVWIDNLVVSTRSNPPPDCSPVVVTSLGFVSYFRTLMGASPLAYVLDTRLHFLHGASVPHVTVCRYFRMTDAAPLTTAVDATGGLFYNNVVHNGAYGGAVSQVSSLLAPGRGDAEDMAAQFQQTGYVVVNGISIRVVDVGFTYEAWINLGSTVVSGDASLVSDDSVRGDGCGLYVSTAMKLRGRVVTSLATTVVEYATPLVTGVTYHVALRFDARLGEILLFVNGGIVPTTAVTGPLVNFGAMLTSGLNNPLYIGYNGVAAGRVVATIDEVAVYPSPISGSDIFLHATLLAGTYTTSTPSSWSMTVGGVPLSPPAGPGIWLVQLDFSNNVVSSGTFNFCVANASAAVALTSAASFINAVPSGNVVLVSMQTAQAIPRFMLLEETINPCWTALKRSRLLDDQSCTIAFQYMSSWPVATLRTYDNTASFCAARGGVMCSYADMCDDTTYPPYSFFGRPAGLAYTPIADMNNMWIQLGTAYQANLCRNYTAINGAPVPTGWVAPSDSTYLCCQRAQRFPLWREELQIADGCNVARPSVACTKTNGVTGYQYPYDVNPPYPSWFIRQGWFESNSYYYGLTSHSVGSPGTTYWQTICSANLLGHTLIYDTPASKFWTDYTIDLDVFAYTQTAGVIFRYQNKSSHYMWTWNPYPGYNCQAFVKRNTTAMYKHSTFNRWYSTRPAKGPALYNYWQHLRIQIIGTSFTVFLDGALAHSWTDDSQAPLLSGGIGIMCANDRYCRWDNIRVWSGGGVNGDKLAAALKTVGIRAPDLNASGLSFVAIGRKNSTGGIGTYGSAVALAGEGPATISSLFNCPRQVITIPENSLPLTAASWPVLSMPGTLATDMRVTDGDPSGIFFVDPRSGDVTLTGAGGSLNFEAQAQYDLGITGAAASYDSGWQRMQSNDPAAVFKELTHGINAPPGSLRVRVWLRAADGINQGLVFHSTDSSHYSDDYDWWPQHGGVISAYSSATVRLWAPQWVKFQRGAIFNVMAGVGATFDGNNNFIEETNAQISHTAEVRVKVTRQAPPDFDTGWFRFAAQQQYDSFRTVYHNLGVMPGDVRVLIRALGGPNAGYVFEGRGDAHRRGSFGSYGGIVFCYTINSVQLFAPDADGGQTLNAYPFYVSPSYGGGIYTQGDRAADVRVQVWKRPTRAPDFFSDFSNQQFVIGTNATMDVPISLPKGRFPEEIHVVVKPMVGPMILYVFPAIGMLHTCNYQWGWSASGVMFAYNSSMVRLWTVSPDPVNTNFPTTYNIPMQIYHGWGGGINSFQAAVVQVQVYGFTHAESALRDSGAIRVIVTGVLEPPVVNDMVIFQDEYVVWNNLKAGDFVTRIAAADQDAGGTLSFEIVGGNDLGAFMVTSDGELRLNNTAAIDFEVRPFIFVAISVTDGTFVSIGMVNITVNDLNDPCAVWGNTFSVSENSATNEIVGYPLSSYDEDVGQTIQYSIVGGNTRDAFKISPCSGQLRVNKYVLNYELLRSYNLTVMVVDDGGPQTNATAVVRITILNSNDRPYVNFSVWNVPENVLAGYSIGRIPAFDEDNDELSFTFVGDRDGWFGTNVTGIDPVAYNVYGQHHPQYSLLLMLNGLNYEDLARPKLLFNLNLIVVDTSATVTPAVAIFTAGPTGRIALCQQPPTFAYSDICLFVVNVVDQNDPPMFPPQSRSVYEHALNLSSFGDPLYSTDEDNIDLLYNPARLGDPAHYSVAPSNPPMPFGVTDDGQLFVLYTGAFVDVDPNELEPVYRMVIRVSDSGGNGRDVPLIAEGNVTIVTLNVNDPPFIAGGNFSISEQAPVGTRLGSLLAWDPDRGDSVTIAIAAGDPYGIFTILDFANLTLAAVDTLDYLATPLYNLTVVATDTYGANRTAEVTIYVLHANHPPVFRACPPLALRPVEYTIMLGYSAIQGLVQSPSSAVSVHVFNLGLVDGSSGYMQCQMLCIANTKCAAFSYFSSQYRLSAWQAQCWGRDLLYSTLVNLAAFGSVGTVTTGVRTPACEIVNVTENNVVVTSRSAIGTQVGYFLDIADPEGDTFDVFIDPISDPFHSFAVDQGGNLTIAAMNINFEGHLKRLMLLVRANDHGHPPANATTLIVVQVVNVNEPPTIHSVSFFIAENDAPGTLVGAAMSRVTRDDDTASGQILQYRIAGATRCTVLPECDFDPLSYFTIDSRSGQISLLKLNNQSAPVTFNLTIGVNDGQYDRTATCVVSIVRVNHRPQFLVRAPTLSVKENSPVGTVVGVVNATDQDYLIGQTLSYFVLNVRNIVVYCGVWHM